MLETFVGELYRYRFPPTIDPFTFYGDNLSVCRKFDTDRCNRHRQSITFNSSPVVADPGTFYRSKIALLFSKLAGVSAITRCGRQCFIICPITTPLHGHRVWDIDRKLPFDRVADPYLWQWPNDGIRLNQLLSFDTTRDTTARNYGLLMMLAIISCLVISLPVNPSLQ